MLVMILSSVSVSLRGELSRWLIEPVAGTFVGNVSGLVRDHLWELTCSKAKDGSVTQLYRSNNEQGFVIRQFGTPRRTPIDFDGVQLIKIAK
ncbi:MAG: type I-E CRISPR-associated endoribonuclease Cas2e [Ignavibacteria bacterium]|nr:type I-E CRISPR-associated endoribonuclease Cas2e [Ignavibacteria bacterium]